MRQVVGTVSMTVIFVSAYGQDRLIARAFEAGAADCVVKPLSPTELVARIRATLHRREVSEPAEPFHPDDLVIDFVARSVTLVGHQVRLTSSETRSSSPQGGIPDRPAGRRRLHDRTPIEVD